MSERSSRRPAHRHQASPATSGERETRLPGAGATSSQAVGARVRRFAAPTADFSPDPVICTTSRREELAGLFNCTWSSCREGCTSDVYRCTHIYVTYTPWSNASMKNDTGGRGNSTGIAHTSTTSGKKVFNLRRRPAYFCLPGENWYPSV